MPHTRSVSICFFIGVGSRYESEAQAGISHFIEHLCFKGTPTRPTAKEISVAIEGVGGTLNGGTDKELTVYWCKVAQPHFTLALDVLVDMLLNSRFDPVDVERERQVIIEETNTIKDSPSQEVNLLIDEILWPGHPLGRDIAGSKDSMSAITRDMMLDYFQGQYLPDNTVVSIAGNIQHQEAEAAVRKSLSHWAIGQPRNGYLAYNEKTNPRLHVKRRKTEEAHLCLAFPGLPLLHPKRFTLDLLNIVLGEGMSSRLFTEIRDKLGLAYSIYSAVDHLLDTGAVTVYAAVDPKNLRVTVKAILEQLSQIKEPVPEAELAKAKELSKGRLLLRMEDTHNVAGWTGAQEILARRILSVDQIVSIIDAISPGELKDMASELIVDAKLRLAVVGPVAGSGSLEKLLKL